MQSISAALWISPSTGQQLTAIEKHLGLYKKIAA
jgi:hypothetical protein